MVGTSYQSIVVNPNPTSNDDNDIGHNSSHNGLDGVAKRRIAVAVVVSIFVAVFVIASGTPSDNTSYFSISFAKTEPGECSDDDDCDDYELMDPNPDDEYLLPRLSCDKKTSKCVIFKRDEPLGRKGYPVMLPNDEVLWIPREEREFGPIVEQVWHWRIDNQPQGTDIRVNGTHVFFPLNSHTVAGYARSYHALNERESGIVSMSFCDNPISILSPRVIAGMAEKYHTLTYEDGNNDELDESNVEATRAEVAGRTESEDKEAIELRGKRDFNMVSALLQMGIADKLTEGCLDKAHVQQLRDLLRDTKPNDVAFDEMYTSENREDHSTNAIQALRDVKTKPSLKTEQHCKHFEAMEGMKVDAENKQLIFPLNKKALMMSGVTQFAPLRRFGLSGGAMIATYDAKTNSVEFYYHGAQQAHVNVGLPESDESTALFVSPIHPSVPLTDYDGRTDRYYSTRRYGPLADFFYENVQEVPVDFSRFDESDGDACPPEMLREMKPVFGNVTNDEVVGEEWIRQNFLMMKIVVQGVQCGYSYLRPDKYLDAVGYRMLEFMVWAHMVLEAEPEDTFKFTTRRFWDEWQDYPLED